MLLDTSPSVIQADQYAASLAAANDVLQRGRRVRLRVAGTSMWPLVGLGDAVWVEHGRAHDARCGDIVVLRTDDALLTHRLVRSDGQRWYTKGDNCRAVDAPVVPGQCLGRVVAVERGTRYLSLQGSACWTLVNRIAGRLGRIEGAVFAAGCRIAERRPESYARRLCGETVKLTATALRVLLRIVITCGILYHTTRLNHDDHA